MMNWRSFIPLRFHPDSLIDKIDIIDKKVDDRTERVGFVDIVDIVYKTPGLKPESSSAQPTIPPAEAVHACTRPRRAPCGLRVHRPPRI